MADLAGLLAAFFQYYRNFTAITDIVFAFFHLALVFFK